MDVLLLLQLFFVCAVHHRGCKHPQHLSHASRVGVAAQRKRTMVARAAREYLHSVSVLVFESVWPSLTFEQLTLCFDFCASFTTTAAVFKKKPRKRKHLRLRYYGTHSMLKKWCGGMCKSRNKVRSLSHELLFDILGACH